MLKNLRILPVILSIAVMILSGCATDECLQNRNSLPLAGFYTSGPVPAAIALDSISVEGIGAPGDSILVNVGRNVESVYLPFDIDANETSFLLIYDFTAIDGNSPLFDEITFRYDAQPYFVSSACGVCYNYNITDIQHSNCFIDSVTCPGGKITSTPGENIRIYFRTSAPAMKGGIR